MMLMSETNGSEKVLFRENPLTFLALKCLSMKLKHLIAKALMQFIT